MTPHPHAADRTASIDWDHVRLHVVSGKGGTGKSTVAAALAIALANQGRKVLLVEVEGRQGIAHQFDIPPLPYEERRIAGANNRGSVYALATDPEAAMLDYLEMFYNIKRGGKALKRIGAVDFATTIAPGLRDVLLTGKTGEAARRRKGQHFVYDAVVLDAPPTGRIVRFLTANGEAAGLARVGPIKNQAETVMRLIRSEQTAVHLVTLLEEMPVQETLDGLTELSEAELHAGLVIVNMARRDRLAGIPDQASDEELVGLVSQGLTQVGLADQASDRAVLAGLTQEIHEHRSRVNLERTERQRLEGSGRPIATVPMLVEGIDSGGLFEIAEILNGQGIGVRNG